MAASLADVREAEGRAQETRLQFASTFDRLVESNIELAGSVRRLVTSMYLFVVLNVFILGVVLFLVGLVMRRS